MENKYAGFWIRLISCWIDYLVILTGLAIIGVVSGIFISENAIEHLPRVLGGVIAAFLVIIYPALYFSFMDASKYQATLGRMALGLKVVNGENNRISFHKALLRNILKMMTLLIPPLYLTFIVLAVSKRKQSLYDKAAGTFVIRDARGAGSSM